MENKNQIKLNFTPKDTFMKVRKDKPNCEICDTAFKDNDETHVALCITNKGENKIMCNKCGKALIEKGVVDINKELEEAKMKKLLGNSKEDKELRESLNKINNYPKPYQNLLQELCKEYEGMNTIVEIDNEVSNDLSMYDEEIDRESHRWWDVITVIKKIGNKYFQYNWATANRDESVEELGWEFDINTVKEVQPYNKTITVTKYKEIKV